MKRHGQAVAAPTNTLEAEYAIAAAAVTQVEPAAGPQTVAMVSTSEPVAITPSLAEYVMLSPVIAAFVAMVPKPILTVVAAVMARMFCTTISCKMVTRPAVGKLKSKSPLSFTVTVAQLIRPEVTQ